jgi:pimeloyl-ACP methyl ester carboxylesterase
VRRLKHWLVWANCRVGGCGESTPGYAAARADEPPAAISAAGETFRLIGSHGFASDEQYVRDLAGPSWDRGYDPDGYRRHLAASASQPNRTADLGRITVPTLVIHVLHDPAGRGDRGLAIARAIPGSASRGSPAWGTTCPGSCGRRPSAGSRR